VRTVSTSDQYVCSLSSLLRRFGRRNILAGSCHAKSLASRGLVYTTLTLRIADCKQTHLPDLNVNKLESPRW